MAAMQGRVYCCSPGSIYLGSGPSKHWNFRKHAKASDKPPTDQTDKCIAADGDVQDKRQPPGVTIFVISRRPRIDEDRRHW